MGRKKGGRRRRRSEAAQLAARYNERGLEREVDNALAYQKCKTEHSEHAKQVARREQELLSRTIFVTNVKDLQNHHNLMLLKSFFEREYGPVEQCILASYSGKRGRVDRFPKARVRFRLVKGAQAIFGGMQLSTIQSPVQLHNYTVGHRGFLRVMPSQPYPEMDESIDENKVIVTGYRALVGHWCPLEDDEDVFFGQDEIGELQSGSQFLIEGTLRYGVELSVDIISRTVQVHLLPAKDCMMSFCFKDLQGTMGCFREFEDAASYAIVFRLKHPPKLYELRRQRDRDGVEEEIATRCLDMGGVTYETYGTCYGYMVQVSHEHLQSLFASERKLRRLKDFGLISRDLYSPSDAPIVSTRQVGHGKARVKELLRRTTDRQVGKFVSSHALV